MNINVMLTAAKHLAGLQRDHNALAARCFASLNMTMFVQR